MKQFATREANSYLEDLILTDERGGGLGGSKNENGGFASAESIPIHLKV